MPPARFLLALALAAAAHAKTMDPTPLPVYLGSSGPKARGIWLARLDRATGALSAPELAAEVPNASFLALGRGGRFLYAVSEVAADKGGAGPQVLAFSVDRPTGRLSLLNAQPSGGGGPCHLALDPAGRALVVANYTGGTVASFPIGPDGRLGQAASVIRHEGASVHPRRQSAPHPHGIAFDPSGRFALVADLGLDKVLVYRFDAARATLAPSDPPFAATRPGAGPRHLAFDASGTRLWAINELDSTITGFAWDPARGTLREPRVVSTLPPGTTVTNYPAEIALRPDGPLLYASNRGHDSLAVFAVAPVTGALKLAALEPCGGKGPRHFALDPSGRWLLAANQGSDSVSVFRVDEFTGRLAPTGQSIAVGAACCVVFLPPARSPGAD
jgi:6-phosphogluconolactonase